MRESIFLRRLRSYDAPQLEAELAALLDAVGCPVARGDRVLVKPNLVAPRNIVLACSHPAMVRAVCQYLLARGATVTVADSPAFGTGRIMARLSGLTEALADLPVQLTNLDNPQPIHLGDGGTIGVSQLALQVDHIINVARVKCHDQMGLTLAVKNFFGCVVGFRKSLAHQRFGKKKGLFPRMILDVLTALPPTTSLLDGIVAMHKAGPVAGEAFPLGLLGAARNPVALDTAVYTLFGLSPEQIPLWREAWARDLPGAYPDSLDYPLDPPEAFDPSGFHLPPTLAPVAFEPMRFLKGRLRSLRLTLSRGR